MMLLTANVFDSFRQNLPFAGFCASILGNGLVQVLEQILHLTTTLSFGKFVTDSELWRPAVVTNTLCVQALMLQARNGAVLKRMVVRRRRLLPHG